MIRLLCFVLAVLTSPLKSKIRLSAENAALRHQLIVLRRKLHGRVHSQTAIAGSLYSYITGFHQSQRSSRSSVPRPLCVGIGLVFAATGAGSHDLWEAGRRSGRDLFVVPTIGVLHHHYVRVSVFGTHRSSLVIIRRISHSQTAPPRAVCLIRGIISVWIKQTSCPNVKLFQCGCYRFIMCPFRTSSSRCFSIFSGSSSSSRVSSDRALSSTRSSSSSFACKARVSRRFAL